jgi:hypothetical protein
MEIASTSHIDFIRPEAGAAPEQQLPLPKLEVGRWLEWGWLEDFRLS